MGRLGVVGLIGPFGAGVVGPGGGGVKGGFGLLETTTYLYSTACFKPAPSQVTTVAIVFRIVCDLPAADVAAGAAIGRQPPEEIQFFR